MLCKMLSRWSLVVACGFLFGACQEDLEGGAACPVLCAGQELAARDTVLSSLSLDTPLVGYPPLGSEAVLLLASRVDTLVTAPVARFDTLSSVVRASAADTTARPVTGIDSAAVILEVDTVLVKTRIVKAPVTIDVYDVDTTGVNLDVSPERSLFRDDRRIASRTFPADSLLDTLSVPLPTEFLLQRVLNRQRVRVGFVARSDSSVQIYVRSLETPGSGAPPTLRNTARADTVTATVTVTPTAEVSGEPGPSAPGLADYLQVLVGTAGAPPGTMAVGGLPGSRAYLRFSLPPGLIDSTTVVRARLLLTQTPNRTFSSVDTARVLPKPVLASPLVPPAKAALLLSNELATLTLVPQDSGQLSVDVVSIVRQWRLSDTTRVQRALVLQLSGEGTSAQAIYFFSTAAPVDSLRPRLRLSYIPRAGIGLP